MNTPTRPLAIFKPGRHVANSGLTLEFSDADVAAMADAYDPELHRAPLVIGHPKTDDPAFGWTRALEFADGILYATADAVKAEFSDWVNAGFYKKISAAFYPPDSPNNPKPGVYYLRHIGFLGAHPPAIKGLPEPSFTDDTDFIILEFAEEPSMAATTETEEQIRLADEKSELARQKDALKQQQAEFAERESALQLEKDALTEQRLAAHKRELTEFTEGLIKQGRLLPKDKSGAIEFMATLSDSVTIEFGEGDSQTKTAALAWFKGFLAAMPKQVEFNEVTPPNTQTDFTGTDDQSVALKDKWNRDAALRAEFGEFETYAAYAKADAAGLVKILE